MKKHAATYKILGFLLSAGLILSGLEAVSRALFAGQASSPSKITLMLEQFENTPPEVIEVALLGNSHMYDGVISLTHKKAVDALLKKLPLERIMPSDSFRRHAFNLAGNGQDLYYDLGLWRSRLRNLPALRYLILSLDYYSFGYDLSDWETNLVFDYEKAGLPPHRWILRVYNWFSEKSYFLRYRKKLLWTALEHRFGDVRDSGRTLEDTRILFRDLSDAERNERGRNRALHHMRTYKETNEARFEHYAKTIIREAQEKNIHVLLVTLPTYESYRSAFPPSFKKNFYRKIAALHAGCADPGRLTYLDFSDVPSFQIDDFKDADHLNIKGRLKFTNMLGGKLSETVPF